MSDGLGKVSYGLGKVPYGLGKVSDGHLSPVICHLTTTLSSFSGFESPRKIGDEAAEGFMTY